MCASPLPQLDDAAILEEEYARHLAAVEQQESASPLQLDDVATRENSECASPLHLDEGANMEKDSAQQTSELQQPECPSPLQLDDVPCLDKGHAQQVPVLEAPECPSPLELDDAPDVENGGAHQLSDQRLATPWTPAAWTFVDTPLPSPVIQEGEATHLADNAAPRHFSQWPVASPDPDAGQPLDVGGVTACPVALRSIPGLTPLNLQALTKDFQPDTAAQMRLEPPSCISAYSYTYSNSTAATPCCSPDGIPAQSNLPPSSADANLVLPAESSDMAPPAATLDVAPPMANNDEVPAKSICASPSIVAVCSELSDCFDSGGPPKRRSSLPPQRAVRRSVVRRFSVPWM